MANTPTVQADQIANAIITAPGQTLSILQLVPGSAQSYSSGTYADIGSGGDKAEATFSALFGGKFVFYLAAQHHNTGTFTSIGYRLVIDESNYNGFTEQIVEPTVDYAWSTLGVGAGLHGAGSFMTPAIILEPGEHKILVQYKVLQGSGAQLDTDDYVNVSALAISGSGAGGTLVQVEELSADFSQAVTAYTFVDIPNLNSITFDAIDGEYVEVHLSGSIDSGGVTLTSSVGLISMGCLNLPCLNRCSIQGGLGSFNRLVHSLLGLIQ